MDSMILLMVYFAMGIALRRSGRLPANAHSVLNSFIIHVSLPALTLVSVHRLSLSTSLLTPVLLTWVTFGVGCAFFWWVGRLLQWRRGTMGALMLTGALASTSIVGLPMIEAHFGRQSLGLGILIGQAGTFLCLSTFGVLVATICAQGKMPSLTVLAKKVFTFTPFLALLLALALMPVSYPVWVEALLDRLGGILVPLAIISAGYQVQLSQTQNRLPELATGIVFKLVLAPLVLGLLYAGLFGARGEVAQIAIFQAAMPSQVAAAIIAMEHDLDPQLAALMAGVSVPLSFLTIPLWRQALDMIA